MKRQLNIILTEMFEWKRAFCVFTRVDFKYLKKTGFSLAWPSSKIRASKQPQIVMVASGKTNDNIRGEYIVANILDIKTCEEIKKLYNDDKSSLSEKLATFIEFEKKISISTFYENKFLNKIKDNFIIDQKHDKRLIIEFDNEITSIEEGKIDEEFKGHERPVYIPKR